MARTGSKLLLLLWKNYKLQIRHPIQTVVEILVPVAFMVLVVVVRSLVTPKHFEDTLVYDPFTPWPGVSEFQLNATDGFKIALSPRDDSSAAFTNDVKELGENLNVLEFIEVEFFPTASKLEEQLKVPGSTNIETLDGEAYLAGIILEDTSNSNSKKLCSQELQATFRFPGELRINNTDKSPYTNWRTNLLYPMASGKTPRNKDEIDGGIPYYRQEGFLGLQAFLTLAIGNKCDTTGTGSIAALISSVLVRRFPFPPYVEDNLLEALQIMLSMMVMLSFLYPCIATVKMITTEKERQLKESMKIMGLSSGLHWIAWFVKSFLLFLVSAILIVILLKVRWYTDSEMAVFPQGSGTLIFVFLLLYLVATICFCFMISVFFSKASTAAVVSGLVWFISLVPYSFLQEDYETMALSTKLAISLFSNSAMAYGFQVLVAFEGTGEGASWSTIMDPSSQDDNLAVGHTMIMLAVDSLLYLCIALYVEAVFPGDYGVPKKWYFLCQKSFWVKPKPRTANENDIQQEKENFEEEPKNLPAGIQIRNLRKVFSGNKVAVDNLNLNMYEGQITVLLGHNGAGKTTTMSMLTGMYTSTSGTAVVGGYDICTDIDGVRDSLGLCPQHNVLFDELTVREHLYFFAKLKGLEGPALEEEIKKYVALLQLQPKENAQSRTLSGGMKRKLSAGVALCGKSNVVLFDEPTAGMDPAARRALWDLLQEEKAGRTVLLTTHFMDEADLLGDRIAIMAGGRVKCCGSSFFLKKRYGAGYRLVVAKGPNCRSNDVTELLRRHLPGLSPSADVGSELSYQLEEEHAPRFEPMLRELEDNRERLGVLSYGVSLTTMEEVFMKVGKDEESTVVNGVYQTADAAEMKRVPKQTIGNDSDVVGDYRVDIQNGSRPDLLTGGKLLTNQLRAALTKKALVLLRGWILFVIQCLLPVFLLIISIIMARVWVLTNDLPSLTLTLTDYRDSRTVMAVTDSNSISSSYVKDIHNAYQNLIPETQRENIVASNPASKFVDHILDKYEENFVGTRRSYVLGASFDVVDDLPSITAWFNDQPYHGAPVAFNMVANAILKAVDVALSLVNFPLPYSQESQIAILQSGASMGFQLAFNLGFSMSLVSAFYTMFPVRERVTKAKHLQFVSGADVLIFWGTHLLIDGLSFLFASFLIVAVLAGFQEDGFSSFEELARVFLILFTFGWAMIPLMYLLSFWADVPSSGFTKTTILNMITGCALFMVMTTLSMPQLNLGDAVKVFSQIFVVLPHYGLCSALNNVYMNYAYLKACEEYKDLNFASNPCNKATCAKGECVDYQEDYFSFEQPGIGLHILAFIVMGCIFNVLLLLIEFRVFTYCCKCQPKSGKGANSSQLNELPTEEDSDVLEEKERICSQSNAELIPQYSLVLRDVTKFYGSFRAVDQISIGIKRGECFGLLGVNGAGKTTTFKMMTGDEEISAGEGFLEGLSLKNNMKKVHQLIGYCPQFDALIEELTGRETLRMFCLLRGIPNAEIPGTVERLADQLLFTKHLDKLVKAYSGGNKRKLSTAVALIGEPPVVFLDEPTTGMDPVAKRHLWNVICKVRDSGISIILTSHSMEECEALCTRLVIMVNGSFKCLGSTQHLKNKFAEGYTLIVKVKNTHSIAEARAESQGIVNPRFYDLDPVKNYIQTSFQGAILKEEYMGLMTYFIPPSTLTWSQMFGMMERSKQSLNIEDYSFGQTSLEQVFLSFTKTQADI